MMLHVYGCYSFNDFDFGNAASVPCFYVFANKIGDITFKFSQNIQELVLHSMCYTFRYLKVIYFSVADTVTSCYIGFTQLQHMFHTIASTPAGMACKIYMHLIKRVCKTRGPKTTARRGEKHLSLGIWYALYKKFDGISQTM